MHINHGNAFNIYLQFNSIAAEKNPTSLPKFDVPKRMTHLVGDFSPKKIIRLYMSTVQ